MSINYTGRGNTPEEPVVSVDNIVRETNLPILKEMRNEAVQHAVVAAYAYARELDTGPERIEAFAAYEKIQNALRG